MDGFVGDIETLTKQNEDYRKVLFTDKHLQLVLMSLKPGEEIGYEVHKEVDQFFRIEEGNATFVFKEERREVGPGHAVIVPAGSGHNVINPSKSESLKLYSLYSPPNHPPKTVHTTKKEADEAESHEEH